MLFAVAVDTGFEDGAKGGDVSVAVATSECGGSLFVKIHFLCAGDDLVVDHFDDVVAMFFRVFVSAVVAAE